MTREVCQLRGVRRFHRRLLAPDDGAAVVEFVVLAILVLVPLSYAMIVISSLHSATYGVVTAAREAGRAYVTADSTNEAGRRARAAAALAMADQGFTAPVVNIRCVGGPCLAPGSRVHIEIVAQVSVPLVPGRSHDLGGGSIPVKAVHDTVVDTYRSS
ncbi:MAG: TadE/TadG family type IV pilus assembly protein [Candidatus Nanopelagicales bacterium]